MRSRLRGYKTSDFFLGSARRKRNPRSSLRLTNLDEHGAVTRHARGELVLNAAEIFLLPQIADWLRARHPEVGELCRHRRRLRRSIEQADGHRAVLERTR